MKKNKTKQKINDNGNEEKKFSIFYHQTWPTGNYV